MTKIRESVVGGKWLPFALVVASVFVLFFIDRLIGARMSLRLAVFRSAVIYTMLIVSVVFFAGRVAKFFYGVFLLYLLVVESANLFLWMSFAMPLDGRWLSILSASSSRETLNFISAYWQGILCILVVAVLACWGIAFCVKNLKTYRLGWRSVLVGILLCTPFFAVNLVPATTRKAYDRREPEVGWFHHVFGPRTGWTKGMTAFLLPIDTYRHNQTYYQNLAKACQNPDIPEKLTAEIEGLSKPPLFVFGLGESETRNHWSLYGYLRATIPCLDAIRSELCVFDDVNGVCPDTTEALHFLLTAATVEAPTHIVCTLPMACKRAGYKCLLISVQTSARNSTWNALRLVLSGCDSQIFTEDGRPKTVKGAYDDSVLPYLEKAIAESANTPTVIFLHFVGSHFPPAEFYPPSAAFFHGSNKKVDEYDNATRFHDSALGKIIALLKGSVRPAFFFYVSDHGETPDADNWRCMSDKSLWELPAFAWFSPEYQEKYHDVMKNVRKYTHEKMQADELFDGFLSLCRIKGVPLTTGSFAEGTLTPRKNRRTAEGRTL